MTDENTVYVKASPRSWGRDMVERVLATFVMAFLALYLPGILGGDGTMATMADLALLDKAAFAGCAALLSLLKAVVAKYVGQKDSASIDPSV